MQMWTLEDKLNIEYCKENHQVNKQHTYFTLLYFCCWLKVLLKNKPLLKQAFLLKQVLFFVQFYVNPNLETKVDAESPCGCWCLKHLICVTRKAWLILSYWSIQSTRDRKSVV